MKRDNNLTIVLAALVMVASVTTVYLIDKSHNKTEVVYPSIPQITGKEDVIELPEVTISVPVPKDNGPVLHGSKLCRWYESAGIRAAYEAGDWLESTCQENTCFLMIHETTVPSAYIMAGWLSEARQAGHDPHKDNIELSVFTFRGEKPYDHVIYYPSTDTFRDEAL